MRAKLVDVLSTFKEPKIQQLEHVISNAQRTLDYRNSNQRLSPPRLPYAIERATLIGMTLCEQTGVEARIMTDRQRIGAAIIPVCGGELVIATRTTEDEPFHIAYPSIHGYDEHTIAAPVTKHQFPTIEMFADEELLIPHDEEQRKIVSLYEVNDAVETVRNQLY